MPQKKLQFNDQSTQNFYDIAMKEADDYLGMKTFGGTIISFLDRESKPLKKFRKAFVKMSAADLIEATFYLAKKLEHEKWYESVLELLLAAKACPIIKENCTSKEMKKIEEKITKMDEIIGHYQSKLVALYPKK